MLTRRPLRICQVVPYDLGEPGGVKHHAQDLGRVLREGGDEVVLVGPASRPPVKADTHGFRGVVNIRSNGSDNRIALFVSPLAVRNFFRSNRFDIVHIHEPPVPSLPYWTGWFARSMPQVCTFHAYAERSSRIMRAARRFWASLQFRFFQHGVAVSDAAARYARLTWKRPLVVVPNGIRTELFTPTERRASGPSGPLRLLFVGRLGDPRKGLRHLLAAYDRLRAQGVLATLDVVGELGGVPPPSPRPGLTYHGALRLCDLVREYRACDVFVAPSTGQESFGIVLLEAMACGRPVVCSDIEGYRGTVDPRGAALLPPGDPEALAAALGQLAAQPERRHRMGEVNRERAMLFDWTAVSRRLRAMYADAIEVHAASRRTSVPGTHPRHRSEIVAVARPERLLTEPDKIRLTGTDVV